MTNIIPEEISYNLLIDLSIIYHFTRLIKTQISKILINLNESIEQRVNFINNLSNFHLFLSFPIQSQIEPITAHNPLSSLSVPFVIHSIQKSIMPVFKTPFNGYSVKFSPFYEDRLAVATAQNFGILGNGRLHVLSLSPNPSQPFTEIAAYDTADGVYDLAWSESHDSLIVAAVADGSVKLYDTALPPTSNPIRSLREHTREVHSADYNPLRRDSFLTSSWDDTVKLWTLDRPTSLRTFKEHSYCVYTAVWNPRHADVFASASGDCTLRIWDVREPSSTMVFAPHELEVLACDWNKYDDCVVATSSVDKSIKVWDVRNFRVPVAVMNGHGYAVRKVRFSPHVRNLLVSCSYDMTVCVWDSMVEDALVSRYDHHTEFAVGVDMSVLVEGLMASTGWDELVYVWQHGTDPRAP